jgi:hypothetical protein
MIRTTPKTEQNQEGRLPLGVHVVGEQDGVQIDGIITGYSIVEGNKPQYYVENELTHVLISVSDDKVRKI